MKSSSPWYDPQSSAQPSASASTPSAKPSLNSAAAAEPDDPRDIALLKINAMLTSMRLLDALLILSMIQTTLLRLLPPELRVSSLKTMREIVAKILSGKEPLPGEDRKSTRLNSSHP